MLAYSYVATHGGRCPPPLSTTVGTEAALDEIHCGFRRYTDQGSESHIKLFTNEDRAREAVERGDEVAEVDEGIVNGLFVRSAGTEDGFIRVCLDGTLMVWPDFERLISDPK